MTTLAAPFNLPSTHPWPRSLLLRAAGLALVALAWLAGWALLGQQQALLWQRLPASTVERFVADGLRSPLPAKADVHNLLPACAQAPTLWARLRPPALRQHLAECLATPGSLAQGPLAEQALARYQAQLADQAGATTAWLQAFEHDAEALRHAGQAELAALQAQPAGGLAALVQWLPAGLRSAPTAQRQPVGRSESADRVAAQLKARLAQSQAAVQALAGLPLADALPAMALLASGLKLDHDFGSTPPKPQLVTDRTSLAEALEWQRRAQGYSQRGFSLTELQAVPAVLFATSLLLLAVAAVAGRGRCLPVALWALATLLLGTGALVLTDLALTGDPSMRYLAERQYRHFSAFGTNLSLVWPLPLTDGRSQPLWWPLLAVAMALPVLGLLRPGGQGWLKPLNAWVRASDGWGHGALPMLALLLTGVAVVLFLGMPAATSELLILLGAVGLATYLARQAPLASLGGGLQGLSLGVVLAALAVAVVGSYYRNDWGHILVSVMLATTFLHLFGNRWIRVTVVLVQAALLASLVASLLQGQPVGLLALISGILPTHAQDRLLALFDRFHVAASDLARVRWLIDSAGPDGWGTGYVPWQGLAQARVQDGLPLQGPSDYVLALTSALWGRVGGMALLGATLALFVAAGAVGLQTALRPAMAPALRLLAALGGFGCCLMAFKLVLSVGGVSGVLPLTGLPVALIGYGPITHAAALGYLALALGLAHLRPVEHSRGASLQPSQAPSGAVRVQGRALVLAGAAGVAGLLVAGEWRLGADGGRNSGQRHVSQARLAMAQAITQALVPADAAAPGTVAAASQPAAAHGPAVCAPLQAAADAWNARLAQLAQPVRVGSGAQARTVSALRLDAPRLLAQLAPADAKACTRLAQTLGQMLDTDLARLVGRQAAPTVTTPTSTATLNATGTGTGTGTGTAPRLAAFEQPRAIGARPLDYSTANAWWGLPGCVLPIAGPATGCNPQAAPLLDTAWLSDTWLQRELAPQLQTALRQPVGQARINGRAVATGPSLGLTLHPAWQQTAQQIADCYTGRLQGSACADVLPQDADWQRRHFSGPGALRAGALGLVLVDVETGRVLALAGSVSDCSLLHLGQPAQAAADGRLPALLGDERCAQWPDQRSSFLALQHPALWMFPGGSSIKGLAMVAGIDSGVIGAGQDAYWKAILAESHERLPVQRVALAAGQHYLDVLHQAGFDQPPLDLLWGGTAAPGSNATLHTRWAVPTFSGVHGLRPSRMGLDEAERIRAEKQSGVNVDKRHGRAVMTEFVAARQLADAALGGNDTRVSALGLAQMWRGLDLRANGQADAPALHLLETAGVPLPRQALAWASPQAAQRALAITSGVSASAWKGTAQGACRHVFGSCPAQGLPGVSGKTGSADFLLEEDSPWVKPGQQVPGKLYGGVFTGADGRRYAVAASALRVREGASRTLELSSSAPAEAAFTLMRALGVQATAARAVDPR